MNRSSMSILLLALITAGVAAETETFGDKPRVDVRKSVIENPLKKLVATTRTKTTQPVKAARVTPKETPPTSPAKFENPKVSAGKVRWHADFEKARAAAMISGKPVLLFQMIGRLDQRFT